MLIRLWWKEWRSLAPIMATLLISAGALHWFLLTYGGRDIRNGALIPIALGFAVVYALVAGAAGFAGEREARTLGFLDALPVGRGMLWLGKASFALASSVALGLLLRWGSSLGWRFESVAFAPSFQVDVLFGLLLVEAAVWGLFWSALSKNALTAGILAVLTTAGTATIGGIGASAQNSGPFGGVHDSTLLWLIGLLSIPLAISWVVVNQGLAPRRRFQRWKGLSVAGDRNILTRLVAVPWTFRPSSAFWSVVWQTAREGRVTWLQTLGLGMSLPVLGILAGGRGIEVPILLICCILALLIQGSSVFGLENSAGTRQFLDNQAVPPGTVWGAKVGVWALGLVAFAAIVLTAGLIGSPEFSRPSGDQWPNWATFVAAAVVLLVNPFAVGLVSGMMFTRRITGAMIALFGLFILVVPQVALLKARVIPLWGLLFPPLILLGVSRAWAGDWLANRAGAGRWLKLGALIAVPFAALIAAHVAGRAYGVADIGPQFVAGPPKRLLADVFREADAAVNPNPAPGVFANTMEAESLDWSEHPHMADAWKSNQKAIELTRKALERIEIGAAYEVPGKLTIFANFGRPVGWSNVSSTLENLAGVLAIDSLERRSRGNFDGAWDDILDQFRIVNLYASSARSIADYQAAMTLSRKVVDRALAWSRDPKITVEAIRSARKSFKTVADVPSAAEAIRGELRTIEASLDRPDEEWVDFLTPASDTNTLAPWTRIHDAWVVAPIWERERTRRIVRMLGAAAIKGAGVPPSERRGKAEYWPQIVLIPLGVTPLVGRVVEPIFGASDPHDREVTNRAALDVILALRDWQVVHGGNAPSTLDEVAGSDLGELPLDPYSGRPFCYMNRKEMTNSQPSGMGGMMSGMGGILPPDGTGDITPAIEAANEIDQYQLSSVGPNGQDDQPRTDPGQPQFPSGSIWDDLIYLLPPNPPRPK